MHETFGQTSVGDDRHGLGAVHIGSTSPLSIAVDMDSPARSFEQNTSEGHSNAEDHWHMAQEQPNRRDIQSEHLSEISETRISIHVSILRKPDKGDRMTCSKLCCLGHSVDTRVRTLAIGGPYQINFKYRRELLGYLLLTRRCNICLEAPNVASKPEHRKEVEAKYHRTIIKIQSLKNTGGMDVRTYEICCR